MSAHVSRDLWDSLQVTSHKATESFYNKIPAEDKKLSLYPVST